MDQSTLFDIISMGILKKWRAIEEKKEDYIALDEIELKEELKINLSENNLNLLTQYYLAITNRMDYLFFTLNKKVFNLGIKIGIDLEKAFEELDDLPF